MRIPNLKLHASAIAIITLVVLAIYMLIGPTKIDNAGKPQLQGDRYIQIDNATWGRNCDPFVDQALKTWVPDPKSPNAVRPHRAAEDNALLPISTVCNGHLSCKFTADTKLIGDDPLPSCFKRLTVRYRCFAYDPLIAKEYGQNAVINLDCTPGKKADQPASPI